MISKKLLQSRNIKKINISITSDELSIGCIKFDKRLFRFCKKLEKFANFKKKFNFSGERYQIEFAEPIENNPEIMNLLQTSPLFFTFNPHFHGLF